MTHMHEKSGQLAEDSQALMPRLPVDNRVELLKSNGALELQFDLTDFGTDKGVRIETYPDHQQPGRTRLLIDVKERCNVDAIPSVHTFAHNVLLPLNADARGI
uniref:Uncharacterized protein n=1 Tax=Plectus sambesii TaxID=2011161 RepID=A0A914UTP0_9BILA